jgi:hypothetical protein
MEGRGAMLRVRIEAAFAVLFGIATVVTALWPTWIEAVFGFEPDGGSGESEWWIVVVLALGTVGAALITARDVRARRRDVADDTG